MDTKTADAEQVLRLLRRLSPRERLQVVLRALLELVEALPDTPGFWESTDVEALVASQGVSPVTDFETLLGGWPEDEPLEPFLVLS